MRFHVAWVRFLWSVGADFAWAGCFLITWIAPDTFGERAVHKFTYIMLMEFLVVHSTGFFTAVADKEATRLNRIFMFSVLVFFYCLFAAGFSAGYGSLWPLWAFLGLALAKLPMIVKNPLSNDEQFAGMAQWAAMTVLYLFGCFATLMFDVPPLGVTPEVIAAQEFGVGGAWPEEPYRVLAFGVLYFTGMALLSAVVEGWGLWRVRKQGQSDKAVRGRDASGWLPKPRDL